MKRNLSLALCAVMLLCSLASCGGDSADTPVDTTALTSADTAVTSESRLYPDIPEVDLGGRTVMFVGKAADTGAFGVRDIIAEEENGDLLNDAVYARNRAVEETYNVVIEFTPCASGKSPTSVVTPSILSGDNVYDILYDGLAVMAPMTAQGMLIDFYTLPYIDFDAQWWDAQSNEDLSLLGKLYFTYGEHMIGPKSGLYCIFFNKKLAEDYGKGDLYQYVYDDKWTLDTFASLAKDMYSDLNSNGKTDCDDIYGFVTEAYNAYTAMIGSGIKIADKDSNDVPILTMNTERALAVFDKMFSVFGNESITFYVNDVKDCDNIWSTFWNDCFVGNKMLFREGAMHDVPNLRNMDADFGILPMPKYDETQDRYYHTLSVGNAQMMSMPISCSEPEEVALILEAMACESLYTITPAYYDVQLKTKNARDDQSAAMLDVIFGSKTFDIGSAFGWGQMYTIYTSLASSRKDNFSSIYASKESAALTEMQATIDQLAELG